MVKKIFITFGGPSPNYHNAVKRICKQAADFSLFDTIVPITDKNLKEDKDFWTKHGNFISNNGRGYGYWLWKSYIVKKQLEIMDNDDILLYADSGCTLNIKGKDRLLEYFSMAENSEDGIVSFKLTHLEKTWTKMDVIDFLDGYKYLDTEHLVGGIFLLKKTCKSVELVNKWYETSCIYDLINDSPSKIPNNTCFREARHDQSIWSIIRKKSNGIFLNDETYFRPWSLGENFPILATRTTR